MVSTFTANIQLEEPARGDDVGTWDTPVNNNMTLIDLVAGAVNTISLNNSPVVLAAAQYQSRTIIFNSTLTGSVTITFPTSFKKDYNILNNCTGSSAFIITLTTTAATGEHICPPPGSVISVINDGSNLLYASLERIGSYWDYAGSSVPAWVAGCSRFPYLNCDGTAFSSASYPNLATVLGSATLPNSKGRARFALDQGAGVISTAATGFGASSGATATGGAQATTLVTANLPAYTPTGSVAISGGTVAWNNTVGSVQGGGPISGPSGDQSLHPILATLTGVAQGGVSTPMTNLPPAYIGGLTLIRAG